MGEPLMTWDNEGRSLSISITEDVIAVGGVNEDGRLIHTSFDFDKDDTSIPATLSALLND